MEFIPLEIKGVFGLKMPSYSDSRGTLRRIFDSNSNPTEFNISQSSYVSNPLSLTLRGLHFQKGAHSENKFVHCISGRIFDVLVDLRKESGTYLKHISVELGPQSKFSGLFVPKQFAHGYLTLESNSNLVYFMDKDYSQDFSSGYSWNDSKLGISWPTQPEYISEQDQNWRLIE